MPQKIDFIPIDFEPINQDKIDFEPIDFEPLKEQRTAVKDSPKLRPSGEYGYILDEYGDQVKEKKTDYGPIDESAFDNFTLPDDITGPQAGADPSEFDVYGEPVVGDPVMQILGRPLAHVVNTLTDVASPDPLTMQDLATAEDNAKQRAIAG